MKKPNESENSQLKKNGYLNNQKWTLNKYLNTLKKQIRE